jgi:predicted secreted protein
MSGRGCNSPSSTGEETARKNANFNSGTRGTSSRHARCRGSGRRATKWRLNREAWAANTGGKTNKQLKHEEVMGLMSR